MLSPRGERVVAHDPQTTLTVVCDTATGKAVAGAQVDPPASPAEVVAVDDDGTVALGGSDGYVAILSPVGRDLVGASSVDIRFGGESATVTALALRGGTLAAGIDQPPAPPPAWARTRSGSLASSSGMSPTAARPCSSRRTTRRCKQSACSVRTWATSSPRAWDLPGDAPMLQVWETATRRRLGRALTGLGADVVTLGGDATRVLASDEGGGVYESVG